jgi:hypothetical protein
MNHLVTDSVYLRIGSRRQFFFDDLLLEQTQNLTRRFHSPEPVMDQPVLQKDRPWEHVPYLSCNTWNVIRDPRDQLFKCWYEDWEIHDLSNPISWVRESDKKLCLNLHLSWPSRNLYAESVDGIEWTKPECGLVTEQGHNTNIVLGGRQSVGPVHCAYVLLDESEKVSSQRFKMVFENMATEDADDQGGGTFRVAFSEDGIHWEVQPESVQYGSCGSVAGDVVTVSVEPESGVYRLNGRHPLMCSAVVQDLRNPTDGGWMAPSYPHQFGRENKRRIYRAESRDMIHWSTPAPLVVPESEVDNIDDEFYGMEQFQIGDDWLGLLNILHNTDNTMDVQLTYSRDGRDFNRVQPGRAWLTPGGPESWNPYMTTVCSKPIEVGDELYVYHGGANVHHDWWMVGVPEGLDVPESGNLDEVRYGLGLATMKRDRFVGLAAGPARTGVLVTRPIFPTGDKLLVNVECAPEGSLEAAIADDQGVVVTGFERTNCQTVSGDGVALEVKWKGQSELPTGRFVRLHFFLQNAELYSFQFIDRV